MDEIMLRIFIEGRQSSHPTNDIVGQLLRPARLEAVECGTPAIVEPARAGCLIFAREEQHLLMVAHQAVHEPRAGSGEVTDCPDDACAVGPTVDIVTEENNAAGPAGGVGLDFGQKNGKKIAATVDVA